jgi:ribosomal protein S7
MGNKKLIKKTLYKILLGFLVKKGNSVDAKKILINTFTLVAKKTGVSKEISFLKLFISLNSFVETKKVRVRKKFVTVPFSINLKRRSYLIISWLIKTTAANNLISTFSEKLSSEIINVILGNDNNCNKSKVLNILQALQNRSNIHYRW